MTIAKILKLKLLEEGKSIKELASSIGVSRSYIYGIMGGNQVLSVRVAVLIGKELGIGIGAKLLQAQRLEKAEKEEQEYYRLCEPGTNEHAKLNELVD